MLTICHRRCALSFGFQAHLKFDVIQGSTWHFPALAFVFVDHSGITPVLVLHIPMSLFPTPSEARLRGMLLNTASREEPAEGERPREESFRSAAARREAGDSPDAS